MEKPMLIIDLGVIKPREESKYKKRYGMYKCPFCGKIWRSPCDRIDMGSTVSCGCYGAKMRLASHTTHGLSGTVIYGKWAGMKARCGNPNALWYHKYGGKGITVCDEWKNDFMSFYHWSMKNGYRDDLEPDRINNSLGYSPENCRWEGKVINSQNQDLLRVNNTSGFRGVYFNKLRKTWNAQINHNGKHYHLGVFKDIIKAAKAYNRFVKKHKSHHPLNIIPDEHHSIISR